MMAKSKVIQSNKTWTIPQIELEAALLACQIATLINNALHKDMPVTCFSDSEIILWWITKDPFKLCPFVANRVIKITKKQCTFRYVNTTINPADIASRGAKVQDLKTDVRKHGPAFLLRN